MLSPDALASTRKQSPGEGATRRALLVGLRSTSFRMNLSSVTSAGGNAAYVPCARLAHQENRGARKGRTWRKAPATNDRRPKADLMSRPTMPFFSSLSSIHSSIHLCFFWLIPSSLLTSRWYPIHETVAPPPTLCLIGTSSRSSTNIQNSSFAQKRLPVASAHPSSAYNRCRRPYSAPPNRCANLKIPAAHLPNQ